MQVIIIKPYDVSLIMFYNGHEVLDVKIHCPMDQAYIAHNNCAQFFWLNKAITVSEGPWGTQ